MLLTVKYLSVVLSVPNYGAHTCTQRERKINVYLTIILKSLIYILFLQKLMQSDVFIVDLMSKIYCISVDEATLTHIMVQSDRKQKIWVREG